MAFQQIPRQRGAHTGAASMTTTDPPGLKACYTLAWCKGDVRRDRKGKERNAQGPPGGHTEAIGGERTTSGDARALGGAATRNRPRYISQQKAPP